MPVKSTDFILPTDLIDDLMGINSSSSLNCFDEPNSEPLLSDDIWKKFEMDFPDFTNIDDIFNELDLSNIEDSLFAELESNEMNCEIRNHDCMWAGHCGSKEHPVDEPRMPEQRQITTTSTSLQYVKPRAPGVYKTPVIMKASLQPGPSQHSLLKPSLRNVGLPIINILQTPPMSDDEENKVKNPQILRILKTSEDEEDDDDEEEDESLELSEYFDNDKSPNFVVMSEDEDDDEEDDEEEEEEEPQEETITPSTSNSTSQRIYHYSPENDHSYHKDKNATMRMANLGIDTPSDSEEEIDVVTLDKYSTTSRATCTLPTNPSKSDRRHLQRTVASAISNKRITNGLKTISPMRKSTGPEFSTAKRRISNETRGIKRTKQYRVSPNPTTSPYKRRHCGNSSDSEPEPSEKRNLHNNMERQRRIDLRNAFEYLRQLVPEVLKKERAAKVVILREASKYCHNLTFTSLSLNKQADDLKRHQERLRNRVSSLRRSLAAKR